MSESEPPIWSARSYDGTARSLVAGLKFGRLLALAEVMAQVVVSEVPPGFLTGTVVPVPAAPVRRRARGFDPAAILGAAVAERTDLRCPTLLVRANGPRQAGRHRSDRMADPPLVRAVRAAPAEVVLVDDVVTTGATLRACAAALRSAGCEDVRAITFAWTPVRGKSLGRGGAEA